MVDARHSFPEGFLWGTATAAHQVEGDNWTNDWSRWEQEPDRIRQGHKAGKACDWWGGRWAEDLDRAAADGQNAHRLSVEWSRLQPAPDRWDDSALEAYRQLVSGAAERGLQPVVTLHHFTNPIWLAEQGGWLNPQVIGHFERFASRVVEGLADRVAFWVTINEPNVYAYAAHASGDFPPGGRSIGDALQVIANMTRAHAAAYRAIHRLQPHALVGLAHHYRGMQPSLAWSPLDRFLVGLRSSTFNDAIPNALMTGELRLLNRRLAIPEAKDTQDYFGLNYYTAERVRFDLTRPSELFGHGYFPEELPVSPDGFIADDPDGFRRALRWAKGFGLPIYVLENGCEDPDDEFRRHYLAGHLRKLWDAVNFNWQVKGYFHWSLVDNFEWERGWTQRFGLWQLDLQSQARSKRLSADFYGEICRQNALTSDIVRRYAPEAAVKLFPHDGPGELP
ncbi:MAG TPA: family 1 glycosylhydrolase [Anaerolineales bacterium]|jgi:beta-glucosidase